LPSRSAQVPIVFRNLCGYEAGACPCVFLSGIAPGPTQPVLAECTGSRVVWEPVRLRSGGLPSRSAQVPGLFGNLCDYEAGACPRGACCHLIFDGNMNAQRGSGHPAPRLPSRSIPAPVYFGSRDVYEAGKARCPSVFEGHLVCACPALFAGKRRAAAAGWAL
jgi:hypothetical protein